MVCSSRLCENTQVYGNRQVYVSWSPLYSFMVSEIQLPEYQAHNLPATQSVMSKVSSVLMFLVTLLNSPHS
ncbi:hypothetical protein LCGC14_1945420, partial [marine sediment metagenome]